MRLSLFLVRTGFPVGLVASVLEPVLESLGALAALAQAPAFASLLEAVVEGLRDTLGV